MTLCKVSSHLKWPEDILCKDKLVLSRPSAAPWYLPFLHPLSLCVMFCCYIAVLFLYPLGHAAVVGERETVETIILLPAVAISSLWDFHARRVFPVVKAGHFCSFPWASGWRVNIRGWCRWKLGEMVSEHHQLNRFVQVRVIQVIIPSLDSITPRFVAKREQKTGDICPSAGMLPSGLVQEGKGNVNYGDNTEASAMMCCLQPNQSSSFDCRSPFQNF